MNFKIADLTKNIKFQSFIGFAIILFFFKLIFGSNESIFYRILNELFVIMTASFFIMYMFDVIRAKKINPLSLIMNIGILNAVIFFLITFSDSIMKWVFGNIQQRLIKPDLVISIVSYLYGFLFISTVSYIFFTFKELFFLKQKKNVSTYFNTMIIFFLAASFASVLNPYPELNYIKTTFIIISVMLIIVNSIRISWIAFLSKKEKVSLLILSVVILILFCVNIANSSDTHLHGQVLQSFSTSLDQFMNLMMIYGIIYFGILFFTTLFHIPTAEAYDRKTQEISSLQYFSKLITQVLDFKELTETVTEIAIKVCNSHAAWIIWIDNGETRPLAKKNIGIVDANLISGYILEKMKSGPDAKTTLLSLDKFEGKVKLSEKFNSLAVSPIKTHNEVKGYLAAAKRNDFIFDDDDKDAIDTFSDYASIAIENSRLLEESIEKERLEKELDVAREIQRKILPSKNPQLERIKISTVFIPAFEVGGDYYDFFELSEEKFGFVIADVSGKGISAAFIMAELKGIFESLSKTIERPKEILVKANEILHRTLDRKSFVSAAYGVIDLKEETLTISRAGHCPVILIRDKEVQNIRPSGIGLGLNFTDHFINTLEEVKIDLKENDLIVLYTDGITEAKNIKLDDFGNLEFEKILLENSDKHVDEISNKVIKDVSLFSQNISQHDDITLVIFRWKQNLNLDGENKWQNSAPQFQTKVK
ncbi:MAG: SpoIIE family protein phosphatase [Ignavibacteriaceae bacterium]|nr:SpoIIE family protein phosphatase [Ignavibacteriaceae bacterium]